MVETFIPDFTTIITQFVLIGGLILGAVKWLESKSEKKAIKAKEEALIVAAELKKVAEDTARSVSDEALKTAADLKHLTETIAKDTRIYADAQNKEAREYYDKKNDEMLLKIAEIDKKVMEMLSDLRKRADLTNGNVSSIRTDIADLQEDIHMIFDEKAEALGGDDPGDQQIVKSRKREQDKRRRNKRRAIERDRVDQSERSLNREH